MAMTVRVLIAALKKMPPTAKICWVDHDHNPDRGEFNGSVRKVEQTPKALKERGYGVMLGS